MIKGAAMMITAVATAVTASLLAISSAHAEVYSDDEFSITYPDGWIHHQQQLPPSNPPQVHNAQRIAANFLSPLGDAEITVRAYAGHQYPAASAYKSESIHIPDMSPDALELISSEVQKKCRINFDGPCWDYQLLDSKLLTAGNKAAGVITYGATIDDQKIVSSMIVISGDRALWIATGTSHESGPVKDVLDAVGSFRLTQQQQQSSSDSSTSSKAISVRTASGIGAGLDDPSIALKTHMHVNLIMIGDAWTNQEVESISKSLPAYLDPIYAITGEKTGIRYHYTYEFLSKPDHVDELLDAIESGSYATDLFGVGLSNTPIWQEQWAQQHELADTEYRLADAEHIESHIMESIIWSDPDVSDATVTTANLVFFDAGPDVSKHIRNYYTSNPDAATGQIMRHVGLMGYGGNYNMFFYDLWAVPWVDYDAKRGQYIIYSYMANMHDCKADTCRADIVAKRASSALYHIVTPSLLYPVEYHDRYKLDVLLYLKPSGRITLTPATLDYFMSKDAILSEFRYLYPLSEWEIEVSIERRDLRGLSYDFKQQFEKAKYVSVSDPFGDSQRYALLSTDNLKPYLAKWGESRQEHDKQSKDVWSIPILVVIENADAEVLFDQGALGIAVGLPDDEYRPCCAIGVADEYEVWNEEIGINGLVLHEVGHLLGLSHPFTSYDRDGNRTSDGYYNWYASPMTYALPTIPTSCGFLYSVTHDEPCGNGAASFTDFERDAITDARILSALSKTELNIRGMDAEQNKHVAGMIYDAVQKFESGERYTQDGALATAIKAYDASRAAVAEDEKEAAMQVADNTSGADGAPIQEGSHGMQKDAQATVSGQHVVKGGNDGESKTVESATDPLKRILVSSASSTMIVAGAAGNAHDHDVADADGDGKLHDVVFYARVSNLQEHSQDVLFIVQVADADGFVVHVGSGSYLLEAAQTITPELSWSPSKPGAYTASILAWSNEENPDALTSPVAMSFVVD